MDYRVTVGPRGWWRQLRTVTGLFSFHQVVQLSHHGFGLFSCAIEGEADRLQIVLDPLNRIFPAGEFVQIFHDPIFDHPATAYRRSWRNSPTPNSPAHGIRP